MTHLRQLIPLADDAGFRDQFGQAKQQAKEAFANWAKQSMGRVIDPSSIFDSQIKRIHEYKRQLLNALHIVILYNRIRANPDAEVVPRTFFFTCFIRAGSL